MKNTTVIPINERFEIRADPWCWVLVEFIPNNPNHHKTKNEYREKHTYHPSIGKCCEFILKETGKDDCETAGDLLNEWQKAVCAITTEVLDKDKQ